MAMPARKSGAAKRKREQCCEVEAAAREFLEQLQISKVYFDPEFDRCYCERCYKGSWPDTIVEEGPTPYVVPRGWFRFGLALQPLGGLLLLSSDLGLARRVLRDRFARRHAL